jgi:urease accessory protein
MQIIQSHLHGRPSGQENVIALLVDRGTLAKRRWRGIAGDGREFGFDLDHALDHGDVIYRDDCACYTVFQRPEPILEIPLPVMPGEAALVAWQVGNLHFPVEIQGDILRTVDDIAVRQMLDREGISYIANDAVFRPAPVSTHAHHH